MLSGLAVRYPACVVYCRSGDGQSDRSPGVFDHRPLRNCGFNRWMDSGRLMKRRWNEAMKKTKSLYHGHRFPAGVISCAVRWYFRFGLSLRDIESLLLERDVVITDETFQRFVAVVCSWLAPIDGTSLPFTRPGSYFLAAPLHCYLRVCRKVNSWSASPARGGS